MHLKMFALCVVELFKSTVQFQRLHLRCRISDGCASFALFRVEFFSTGKADIIRAAPREVAKVTPSDNMARALACMDYLAHSELAAIAAIDCMASDTKPIELATSLGNASIKIEAIAKSDKAMEIAKFALQYLIWHVVPSKAYNKDSKFKRNADYSDALVEHLKSAINTHVGGLFDNIKLTFDKVVVADPIEKLIKDYVGLGFSEVDAKALAADALAKLKEKTAKTEAKPALVAA